MADVASAIAYGAGLQGQATFATGATTAVWAYSPWDSTSVTAGAGTVPTAVGTGSTVIRGNVTFGSGASPATGSQATVTFSTALPAAPTVVLCPGNTAAGTINPTVYAASTTGFVIGAAVAPTPNQAGTIYSINYLMSL